MTAIRRLAERRPILFCLAIFLALPALALPLVALFRVIGLDLVPLRLLIPVIQSAFVLWVIGVLGWWQRGGFVLPAENIHLYGYPTLVAFAPVIFYGTIAIDPIWLVFYAAALLFTGISEEGFARSLLLPALLRYGRWAALLGAAALFSAGHFVNAFFEEFGWLEWLDKYVATFSFAVLYGAVFLRTGNVLPLIVLHALHDYSYLTSGTAGPFTDQPIDLHLHLGLSALNLAVGLYIAAGIEPGPATGVGGHRANDDLA